MALSYSGGDERQDLVTMAAHESRRKADIATSAVLFEGFIQIQLAIVARFFYDPIQRDSRLVLVYCTFDRRADSRDGTSRR
jgi:hypothetical protein